MEIETIVPILMFAGVLIGAFTGFPIAFVLGGLALIFGFIFAGSNVLPTLFFITFKVMKGYVYAAVPLFVFMAVTLERAGLADRLFHVAHLLFGGLRGGAGYCHECRLYYVRRNYRHSRCHGNKHGASCPPSNAQTRL